MNNIDPKLAEILKKYGADPKTAVWNSHGTWVAYHKELERIAVSAKITFDNVHIVEANTAEGIAVVAVTGNMDGRCEWSLGEASPKNNKNAYPWAMAEKRAKDRVILKLIGLHGMVYSEEESDDFKASGNSAIRKSSALAKKDGDYEKFTDEIANCKDERTLNSWWKMRAADRAIMPISWEEPIHEAWDKRLVELSDQTMNG